MKIKIVNIKRFISSILVVLVVLIGFSFIVSNKTFSHGDVKYKILYVASGDTLWTIAKEEQNTNGYFEGKDIRDIIVRLKKTNNLKTSDLIIGEELQIPTI